MSRADVHILRPSRWEADASKIWRRLGYADPSQAPAAVHAAFARACELGQDLLEPAACYRIRPMERWSPAWIELSGIALGSRELAFRCRGAREVAIFIATIGLRLEGEVERLFPQEPTTAWMLDQYGSEAVVALARAVRYELRDYALSHGLRIGERYCPGYGDWETRDQRKLFRVLDGGRIGVQLGPHGMMRPRKSYAGVLPIGPHVREIHPHERCYSP